MPTAVALVFPSIPITVLAQRAACKADYDEAKLERVGQFDWPKVGEFATIRIDWSPKKTGRNERNPVFP